jgi:hypothetical protein
MLNPLLFDAFRYYRNGLPKHSAIDATTALKWARRDVANGKRRYPGTPQGMRGGADFKIGRDSVFWCECPDDYLRRVGYADECGLRSIRHKGWFTDEYGDGELARGVVFQLPARNGTPRFISGVADSVNDGPAILSLELFDDKDDAARNADSLAEIYAEKERDYRRASNAGFRHGELGEEIATMRGQVREILKARRDHIRKGDKVPTILAVLECKARELLGEIEEMQEKRATLFDEYGHTDAFKDN